MDITEKFRFQAPLVALLFFVVGASSFGHTKHPANSESQVAHTVTTDQDSENSAEDMDRESPCKNHSQDPDCNTCPSGGHCHLQATSLPEGKTIDFDREPHAWVHLENDQLPLTITFEPALRPPIL